MVTEPDGQLPGRRWRLSLRVTKLRLQPRAAASHIHTQVEGSELEPRARRGQTLPFFPLPPPTPHPRLSERTALQLDRSPALLGWNGAPPPPHRQVTILADALTPSSRRHTAVTGTRSQEKSCGASRSTAEGPETLQVTSPGCVAQGSRLQGIDHDVTPADLPRLLHHDGHTLWDLKIRVHMPPSIFSDEAGKQTDLDLPSKSSHPRW